VSEWEGYCCVFTVLGTSFLEPALTILLVWNQKVITFLTSLFVFSRYNREDDPNICTLRLPPTRSFERLQPDINTKGHEASRDACNEKLEATRMSQFRFLGWQQLGNVDIHTQFAIPKLNTWLCSISWIQKTILRKSIICCTVPPI